MSAVALSASLIFDCITCETVNVSKSECHTEHTPIPSHGFVNVWIHKILIWEDVLKVGKTYDLDLGRRVKSRKNRGLT